MKMWLVGAGYWGSKLIATLEKFGVEPMVVDIKNGQSIEQSINTLDPVMLATPVWNHYEQAKFLLERGHDLYIEKPMATTEQEILNLSYLTNPGQIVMIGHLFIHHPQIQLIKDLFAKAVVGELEHISSRRLNWGIYQTKTDPLLSLAVHDLSIINHVVRHPCNVVECRAWNYSKNPSQPDRVQLSGETSHSVTFDIDVSWHWPVRTRETVFIGTDGQIVWDQDANTVTVHHNIIQNARAVVRKPPVVYNYTSELSPLEHEIKHWIECLQTRSQPKTNIPQALKIARAIDRASSLLVKDAPEWIQVDNIDKLIAVDHGTLD